MKKIAIIGGGAAGLAASIACGQSLRETVAASGPWKPAKTVKALGEEEVEIALYEMDPRVGRRILVTGNGRCNFSNAHIDAEKYHNASFVAQCFEQVTPEQVHACFADLGLMWTEESDGRLLPAAGKASVVVDVLRARAEALGVEERCCGQVASLVEPGVSGQWTLRFEDGTFERADVVIVATGGQDALDFLPKAVERKAFAPVLGPLKTATGAIRGLDNIRVKATASLVRGQETVATEVGEVLFRKYGVSGICIFNLSRFAEAGDTLVLDLLPQMSMGEVLAELTRRWQQLDTLEEEATVADLLRGMFLPVVAEALCKAANVSPRAQLVDMDVECLGALAGAIKGFTLQVEGIAEPEQCQVHRGGVLVDQMTPQLECKNAPGIFLAGEALDVDAPCGGYNLHWAWASGILAGQTAAERVGGTLEGAAQED